MALLDFWKSNRDLVRSQTVEQVVSNAGDGRLSDASEAQREFRAFLRLIDAADLFRYARHCLETGFTNSGLVLQDVVNELGRRLEFDVENGAYRGKQGSIGFDGIWRCDDEPEIIVEVKTTDAYNIRLDTLIGYKDALCELERVTKDASLLIIVGSQETGALEAQVRGSRYAWDIRLLSVEGLIRLVQVMEESEDPSTATQIRQLIHPVEYTKLDQIVDVIFSATEDVRNQGDEERDAPAEDEGSTLETNNEELLARGGQVYTNPNLLNEKRTRVVGAFGALKGIDLFKRGRALFWSPDQRLRVVCTVSKRYPREHQPYWFAYHSNWDEFLSQGEGYVILACMDRSEAFAIPRGWFVEHKAELNTTEKRPGKPYWHIALAPSGDGSLAVNASRAGRKYEIKQYAFETQATKRLPTSQS